MPRLGRAYPVKRVFRPPASVAPVTLIPGAAFVGTLESTTSTTYTALTTTTDNVTVTIGPSGMALVSIFSYAASDTANDICRVSYTLSGANTRAADDTHAIIMQSSAANRSSQLGASFLETGLTAGSTNFAMRYSVNAGSGTFVYRRIAVIPL